MLDDGLNVWHNYIYTHGRSPRPHPEAPRPPSDGHAQSAARPGDRRVIRRQRLLRSARPPAGEVRNAAPRPQRRRHGESGGTALRVLASVLLSRARGVHARRPGRAGAAEARTATRAQALAEGRRIPGADNRRRSGSGLSRRRAAGVRPLRAPTEHRPGAGAREKKTTLATTGHDGHGDRTDSPEDVTRYEDLRRHVIDRGGGSPAGTAADSP